MCLGGKPKAPKIAAAPAPANEPPPPPAVDNQSLDPKGVKQRKKGKQSLTIPLSSNAPGAGGGLNIPS